MKTGLTNQMNISEIIIKAQKVKDRSLLPAIEIEKLGGSIK